jgi:acyl carrier protein
MPSTPEEKALAEIWTEVLKVKRVSLNDNFFDIGGHSLLATRLVKEIRESFNVDLPLSTLFENPTLSALSAIIVRQQIKQVGEENLADMFTMLGHLSDEEVAALLREDEGTEEAAGD